MIGVPANDLSAHGSLLIRRAVLRDDWIADEIFNIRAGDQKQWDLWEWDTVLKELQSSTLTVDEWLTLYT
jgi:hypothetical protein